MTVRPAPKQRLPELVWVLHQVIIEAATTLRAALEGFSGSPQPGCAHELDRATWSDATGPQAAAWLRLLDLTQHQAVLIYVNAYDHMLTLGRTLGGDGATTLFAHVSLSRVACEAAVRCAWLMDSKISPEERFMRGAAMLLDSAEERLRGAKGIPTDRFHPSARQQMISNCTDERNWVQELIEDVGVRLVPSRKGKTIASLELESPQIKVPIKLNVTKLMTELLPESASWYHPGSSVVHSLYWGLRDAVGSAPGETLALTPPMLELGAAAETVISASGLILTRCAGYYGHDPSDHLMETRVRREAIDLRMRRWATEHSAELWHPAPPPSPS